MEDCKVFVYSNSWTWLPARVAAFSVQRWSRASRELIPSLIELDSCEALSNRDGQSYQSRGRKAIWRSGNPNSFRPLRMSIPQRMNFQGRALVLDADIVAVADVTPLTQRDMQGAAILCTRAVVRDLPFDSSVMLLDCAQLEHWQFDRNIDRLFAEEIDYREWAALAYEDPATIGLLEDGWNHRDLLNDHTKLLHNTAQLTQPWKTGLPINLDDNMEYLARELPWANQLTRMLRRVRRTAKRVLSHVSDRVVREDILRPHPDVRQERCFLQMVQEMLDENVIDSSDLQREIELGHVRTDLFERLAS